ncbi:MAG: hypothetical protein D3923_02135, partial [Candidatus Electrothrix sp. AR3]|nr:hypothetical protein [Candidatus Electrothrix sp. AR3]
DDNLENFLKLYSQFNAFYLLPALLDSTGTPEFFVDLKILKKNLTVKLAKDVGEHDIEAVALRSQYRDEFGELKGTLL